MASAKGTGAGKPAATLSLPGARAIWARRQRFSHAGALAKGPAPRPLEDVVSETGWLRTLGGVDAYLALLARVPGFTRAALDAAIAEGRLMPLPAVRACMYLVPRAHAALVLTVAARQHRPRTTRELERAGVSPRELSDVMAAVREALSRGAMSTDALRKALPPGAVRSLGERGKKVGLSSPLPAALRELELQGLVSRLPVASRLDRQDYVWSAPRRSVFQGARVPADPAAQHALLAELFLAWAGPAAVGDFAAWSALPKRDALAAFDAAGARPVTVEGLGNAHVLPGEDLDATREETLVLLPFEDNLLALHQGPGLFVPEALHGIEVPVWGGRATTVRLGEAAHMSLRSIVCGGEVVGFWEHDPGEGRIVTTTLGGLPAPRRRQLEAAADATGRFLRDELGHARSFSLDTEDSLRERAAAIRRGLAPAMGPATTGRKGR